MVSDRSFNDRVEQVLKHRGKTKTWLADQMNMSKQALHYFLSRALRRGVRAGQVADLLGVSENWLTYGEGDLNFFERRQESRAVPLYTEKQMADLLTTGLDKSNRNAIVEAREAPDMIGYILDNNSMIPTFQPDSILLLRRELKPKDGNYVLVLVPRTNQIVLRQFFQEGNDIYLKPENNLYSTFCNEPHQVLGTLVECRKRYID